MNDSILRQARIMIVDDDVGNTCLLVNFLNRLGYAHLKTVNDPTQVCEEFGAFKPDLLLLDINMPELDGFEVLEQLGPALHENEVPILMLTGEVTPANKRQTLKAGASDLLLKPYDPSEVHMRIRSLLRARFLWLEIEQQNRTLEDHVAERTAQLEATVAELKVAQRQMLDQARLHAFAEMAGGVVHDFNNALMSVIGFSDILLQNPEKLGDKKRLLEYLGSINTAGRDASKVVHRLRDFYRPRTEADVFAPIDLNELLETVTRVTQPKWKGQSLANGREVSVQLELGDIPKASGNAAELREVLTNLIFNAVDAMPDGGSITLRTSREEDYAMIEVIDTGIGMTPEVRSRCLEPFFSTKGEKGTGLGLSMVFGILKRHDAKFDIESAPGHGTTFRIALPMATAAAEPAARKTELTASIRILAVDDDAISLNVVGQYLTADGHEVTMVSSAPAAITAMMAMPFDLLVTDHGMPGMNGLELARLMRESGNDIPIILLTGFAGIDPSSKTDNADIDKILHKPCSRVALIEAVSETYSRHQANGRPMPESLPATAQAAASFSVG